MNSPQLLQTIDRSETVRTGLTGGGLTAGGWLASVKAATAVLQFVSASFACLVGAFTLYRLAFPRRKEKKKSAANPFAGAAVIFLALSLASGCTFAQKARAKISGKQTANAAAIAEESAALTTGVVDALALAPTNAPTALALELAKADQVLEGMPRQRIDIEGAIAGDRKALDALTVRLETQGRLIEQKAALEAKLREREAALMEMGAKYEAEKNKSIVRRVWAWATATLGFGGIVALCILCPALIPLFARGAAYLVSLFPKLAGAVGVVSVKAFDAVSRGVENAKAQVPKEILETHLGRAMDTAHKELVKARRAAGVVRLAFLLLTTGAAFGQGKLPALAPWRLAWDETNPPGIVVAYDLFYGTNKIATLSATDCRTEPSTNGTVTLSAIVPGVLVGKNLVTLRALDGFNQASDLSAPLTVDGLGKPLAPQALRKL